MSDDNNRIFTHEQHERVHQAGDPWREFFRQTRELVQLARQHHAEKQAEIANQNAQTVAPDHRVMSGRAQERHYW